MLVHYRKLAQRAVVACVVGYAGAILLRSGALGPSSSSEPGVLFQLLATAGGIGYFVAFWAYARAKGRSGTLGLGLALLSVAGLIILLSIADLSDKPAEPSCSKCGGKNDPSESQCRYCGTSLVNAGGAGDA
jgi:hypothetical protein